MARKYFTHRSSCSGGGTTTGGGTMGGSMDGCFYTNVKKNTQYIGFTVHCTTAGTDCREGTSSGPVLDMAGVVLGTQKNCYGATGGNSPSRGTGGGRRAC